MPAYHYKFVDDYECAEGQIEACDAASAAIKVLQECGTEPGQPRWKRYGIVERAFLAIPRDAELVEVSRRNTYSLDIRQAGTRKRKPVLIVA